MAHLDLGELSHHPPWLLGGAGACPGCPGLSGTQLLYLGAWRSGVSSALHHLPLPMWSSLTPRSPTTVTASSEPRGAPVWVTALLVVLWPARGFKEASPGGQPLHLLPELHAGSLPAFPAYSQPMPPTEGWRARWGGGRGGEEGQVGRRTR